MRNKGYALLELILTMSIIMSISAMVFVDFSKLSKLTTEIEGKYYENAIMNLIIKSKNYCRSNEINGRVVFDQERRTIWFQDLTDGAKSKNIYVVSLPKGYKMEGVSIKDNMIYINANGAARDCAGTIPFKDKNDKLHIITIRVGSSYVDIKKK